MVHLRNKPIPLAFINQSIKTICKIIVKMENFGIMFGTGFFMKIFSQTYLISASHILKDAIRENWEVNLEFYTGKTFKIGLADRFIKLLEMPIDIVAIEIKDSDMIYNDIKLLDYDTYYISTGYSIYKGISVFSLCYGLNGLEHSSGSIETVSNKIEFGHSCSTDIGSAGSPIVIFFNNSIKVIGIHSCSDQFKNLNIGIFIGELICRMPEIINSDKKDLDKNKKFKNNNIDNNIDDYVSASNASINSNSFQNIHPINLIINLTKNEKKDIINFSIQSTNQIVNCNIFCRNNDIFNTIINSIIEKEPLLADIIGYFLCKGNKVNEYKSIKDNKISNNDIVLMNTAD